MILTFVATVWCLFLQAIGSIASNPIDNYFRHLISAIFEDRIRIQGRILWTAVLRKIVLALSDQQLALGLAVLLSGYIRLAQGMLTVYHFSIIMDLAWLSSNIHLLSLIVRREYLRKAQPLVVPDNLAPGAKHKQGFSSMLFFRVFLMLFLAALLLCGSVFQGYRGWFDDDVQPCPANCAVDDLEGNLGGIGLQWLIVNVVFLVFGYSSALLPLFERSRGLRRYVKDWAKISADAAERSSSKYWGLRSIYKALSGCFITLWNFLTSLTFEILFQLAWLIIGIQGLFDDRGQGHSLMSKNDEDMWGFGQLLPLLLLVLPFMSAWEVHHGEDPNISPYLIERSNSVRVIEEERMLRTRVETESTIAMEPYPLGA